MSAGGNEMGQPASPGHRNMSHQSEVKSHTRPSRNAVFSNNKSVDSRFSRHMKLKKDTLLPSVGHSKNGSIAPQKVKLDLATP